jgi:hypothetical protein
MGLLANKRNHQGGHQKIFSSVAFFIVIYLSYSFAYSFRDPLERESRLRGVYLFIVFNKYLYMSQIYLQEAPLPA